MKYVVDTSLVNKLVDGSVHLTELPSDGEFVATHIQRDELRRTKDSERRAALLEKFAEIVDSEVPTESFVLGQSRLDAAKLGEGLSYAAIKSELDSMNKNKANNVNDALITEVASKNGYVLLTSDFHLHQACERLGIGVMYWTT
jgi:rRNA-processing protein FCF1